MNKRPCCVHCGSKYGSRRTTDEVVRRDNLSEPFPPYRGNLIVVKDLTFGDKRAALTTYRTLWDGVSWFQPYAPFCKLRCALDYARKAYRKNTSTM